ncbi:HAD family hydrolase [Kitasatospora sp. NPDC090091]|uniref:HAD family hydrolase n=1 Tax=Kitasatospora sp. NPDC090091 TaxID=3364081 RepID=UPI0038086145
MPSAAGVRVAALDVDGTLVEGTLGWALPHDLVAAGVVTADRLRPFLTYLDHVGRGGLEDHAAAERAWHLYATAMAGVPAAEVDAVTRHTWMNKQGDIHPFACPLLTMLREAGLRPVLVSLGPHDLLGHIADHLGITHYSGTVLEQNQGTYTGRYTGVPVFGKPAAVHAAVGGPAVDWAGSLAMGNSLLDLGLLQRVAWPVAFEPTPGLRRHAAHHGWVTTDRHTVLRRMARHPRPTA